MSTEPDNAIVPTGAGGPLLHLGSLPVNGPRELIETATAIAGELTKVIEDRDLSVLIKNRRYVKCEGWTTCAAMLGVVAREVSVQEHEDGAYEATVELVRVADQAIIGRGSAVCAPDEPRWADAPRYARRSMAVTRATGKACRLAFSLDRDVGRLPGHARGRSRRGRRRRWPGDEAPRPAPAAQTRARATARPGAAAPRARRGRSAAPQGPAADPGQVVARTVGHAEVREPQHLGNRHRHRARGRARQRVRRDQGRARRLGGRSESGRRRRCFSSGRDRASRP